jgi:hypothetical protein
MATRTKALWNVLSTTSRPVWLFVLGEAAVLLVVVAVGGLLARRFAGVVALDVLPPWRALVGCVVLGAAAHAVRTARPIETLRQWHGIAVRRIDERWADDR